MQLKPITCVFSCLILFFISLSCRGGRNLITGGDDHDVIVGGGHSIDVIDAGSGSDLASGDCVWILFDNSDFHLRNITSTSINVGGMDEIRMGDGKHITNVEFSYLLFSSP